LRAILLDPAQLLERQLTLTGENAHYLSRVLRCRKGDAFWLLDGIGGRYQATVLSVAGNVVRVERGSREESFGESPLAIHLVQALLKADKMTWVVQKATELGVSHIHPVVTTRSEARTTRKVDRWRRVAEAATLQAGRSRVPRIAEVQGFEDSLPADVSGVLFWEQAKGGLRDAFVAMESAPSQPVWIWVGPEGGFTADEVSLARGCGVHIASLGARTLRAETAAVCAVALFQYELGDLK